MAEATSPAPSPEPLPTPPPVPPTPAPMPTLVSPVGPPDDGYPDMIPPVLAPEAEKGETGARNLLLSFARAIELEEFDQAWDLLGERASDALTQDSFARQFTGMGRLTVAVGDGSVEGGAGSLYYEVPLRVTGTGGTPLAGTAVLRRVNDVDGATPEQLRWHFDRVNLAPIR